MAAKKSLSSTRLLIGMAALSVVIGLLFVLERGRGQDDPVDIRAPNPEETAGREQGVPDPTTESLPTSPFREDAAMPEPGGLAQPDPRRDAPRMERMPDRVAEDFERGAMKVIPDEVLQEMQAGGLEIPAEIHEEMKRAPSRSIPAQVLEDFQNPYVEISQEELEMLRQNGLESGRR